MKPRIKYIEHKVDGLRGVGRIGRVEFSKTGRTLYYAERAFARLGGWALKANYFDEESWEEYWISGPRRDGNDALFPAIVEIDDDVRQEYWTEIRREPARAAEKTYRSKGKSKRARDLLEKAVRRHDIDRRFRAP